MRRARRREATPGLLIREGLGRVPSEAPSRNFVVDCLDRKELGWRATWRVVTGEPGSAISGTPGEKFPKRRERIWAWTAI
jgi:hypothetical protein